MRRYHRSGEHIHVVSVNRAEYAEVATDLLIIIYFRYNKHLSRLYPGHSAFCKKHMLTDYSLLLLPTFFFSQNKFSNKILDCIPGLRVVLPIL